MSALVCVSVPSPGGVSGNSRCFNLRVDVLTRVAQPNSWPVTAAVKKDAKRTATSAMFRVKTWNNSALRKRALLMQGPAEEPASLKSTSGRKSEAGDSLIAQNTSGAAMCAWRVIWGHHTHMIAGRHQFLHSSGRQQFADIQLHRAAQTPKHCKISFPSDHNTSSRRRLAAAAATCWRLAKRLECCRGSSGSGCGRHRLI
jgi:hypothetical protein